MVYKYLSIHSPLCCFAQELPNLSRSSHMAFLPTLEGARHCPTGSCTTDGSPHPSTDPSLQPIPSGPGGPLPSGGSAGQLPGSAGCNGCKEEKPHTSALVTSTWLHLTPCPSPIATSHLQPCRTVSLSTTSLVGHQQVNRELGLCVHPWAPTELAPGAGD